jgi:hypothetical protein
MRHIMEPAAQRIPTEPYTELPQVLETFVAGVHKSLVVGDELTDRDASRLQEWHLQIHDLPYYVARHLEGSYVSKQTLIRTDLVGVQSLWYVDNGSTRLERSAHDNQWHVRWILHERAAGPSVCADASTMPGHHREHNVSHSEQVRATEMQW